MADRLDRPAGLDAELLARYLAGDCTEAETAVVRRYLMAHPREARVLARFYDGLDAAATRPRAPDTAASLQALRARLDAEPSGPAGAPAPSASPPSARPARPPAPPARGRSRVATLAGSLAAAVVVGVAIGLRQRAAPTTGDTPRAYVTARGQRADVRLADGTRVRVAPSSRLRLASDYGAERRDVYLEGEAYFEVAHDARRPFTVFAGNASVRDLGTAYAVRSYAEDGAVQVVVREGAVALSGVGPLRAGDVARLAGNGAATVRRGVDVSALLGWTRGALAYRDAPLGAVLDDLRRWYDVDLRLADSTLGTLPYTGTLGTGAASDAAELLAATLGLRVRRDGPVVVLEAIPGRTPRPASSARRATSRRGARPLVSRSLDPHS
jgi:transmembrane sensor